MAGRPDRHEPTQFAMRANGHRLAFCEWGAPDGAAVFYLHGIPGSRYLRHVGSVYGDARLRVITYDRPGYGLSDRVPARTVADTAADVAAIADHLGIPRFSVVGVSAGGVHAFAAAAGLPDRVHRCVGIKALAPYRGEGLDFFEGMDDDGASTLRAVARGDRSALEEDAAETSAWVESDLAGISATGPVADMLKAAFREAFRQGLGGHMDDVAAHVRSHGYEIESVTTPTLLLAARQDQQVPPGHARWLADHLPHAELTWMDGGHMDYQEDAEMAALAWAGRALF